MRYEARKLAVLLTASGLLSGCVAAVVPIAAGGLMARRHAAKRAASAAAAAPIAAATARVPARHDVSATVVSPATDIRTLPVVPADPRAMQPGKVYVGAAPSVTSPAAPRVIDPTGAALAGDAETTHPAVAAQRQDWTDLSRYVAGVYARPAQASVLLVRGSTLAKPAWVPCGTKPVAVLVDLESVVTGKSVMPKDIATVLGALETLQVTVAYTTRRGGPTLDAALAAFDATDLHRPMKGATLFPIANAQSAVARASAGARYCVLAIAGDQPDDFPGGAGAASEGWHPGWMLVPSLR